MTWKPLNISASAGAHLPPLLISADFATDSYTIHLSDLTSIWSESLDRREIIRRSREENTSIDPSDSDQFQILQDKIKLGLDGGGGTALALTIQADPSRPSLVLHVAVDLPGGLAPLEWPIRFTPGSQSVLMGQLTRPLLIAQRDRMEEIASLAEILKEKDHVIQKLLDKLESQGTELGQVFPQVAGKVGRKLDRKKAAERVRGLAPFDVGVWRERLRHEESRDISQLIGEVFGGTADALPAAGGDQQTEEDDDEWWDNIKGITVNLDTGKISTKGPSKGSRKTTPLPKPQIRKEESSIDEDAFQVQSTPPRSLAAAKVSPPKAVVDESTDDDDLDAPSQRSTQRSKIPDSYPKSPSPPPKVPSPKPAKKFGIIGGKKGPKPPPPLQKDDSTDDEDPRPQPKITKTVSLKATKPNEELSETESESSPVPSKAAHKARSPSTELAPSILQKELGQIGGRKEPPLPPESETDDEPAPEVKLAIPPKASTPPVVKPKKAKLGQIGGKKKAVEASPATEETVAESATTSPAPKSGVKRKIGEIVPKNSPSKSIKQEPALQEIDDVPRGRAPIKPVKEETPPPRETSEERAIKRREKLKRELEEKAKAPVKKKRKF